MLPEQDNQCGGSDPARVECSLAQPPAQRTTRSASIRVMSDGRAFEGVEMTDVAVIAGDRVPDDDGTHPAGKPPVVLAPGLTLECLPHKEVEACIDASSPAGENFKPARQFGQTYSFVRRDAPHSQGRFYQWDPDMLIQYAIALSRLVRDNAHSAEYTVRVIDHGGTKVERVPGAHWLAWYAPDGQRKWLSQDEAEDLAQLLQRFLVVRAGLPLRVNRGIRLSEDSARTEEYIPAVIWTVSATEALLNTDDGGLRRQFVERTQALAAELGVEGVTEPVAKAVYKARSQSVHGAVPRIEDHDQAVLELAAMQRLIRTALRRAIEDEDFRAVFTSDAAIRMRWSVENAPRQCS
jgi:hypothetical protein